MFEIYTERYYMQVEFIIYYAQIEDNSPAKMSPSFYSKQIIRRITLKNICALSRNAGKGGNGSKCPYFLSFGGAKMSYVKCNNLLFKR